MEQRKNEVTKNEVAKVAWMIGIDEVQVDRRYGEACPDTVQKVKTDEHACMVRALCRVRNAFMKNYEACLDEMLYEFKDVLHVSYVEMEDARLVMESEYQLGYLNKTLVDVLTGLNDSIKDAVGKCGHLFPCWINWQYLKEIFVLPSCKTKHDFLMELNGYNNNIRRYPCQAYVGGVQMTDEYFLSNDYFFLEALYRKHNERFNGKDKVQDISKNTRENIENFIKEHSNVEIVVDCENSDVYKMCSMLNSFGSELCEKISKIVLFDDVHTTDSWKLLSKFTGVPIEYVAINRVTDAKSLVDIRMTAEVTKACYKDGVDGFILLSSDSDYWGLISAVNDAGFFVVYEDSKCGLPIKETMYEHEIQNCSLDGFSGNGAYEFKRVVLKSAISERIEQVLDFNSKDLVADLCKELRIDVTDSEQEELFKHLMKPTKITVNDDGSFNVQIK